MKIQGFSGKEKIEMSKENGYVLHLDFSKFFSGWDAISEPRKENFRRALKAMDEYRSTATATTPVSFVQATFDNFARWEKEQIAKAYKVRPSEVNLKRTIPGTAVQRAEIPKMNLKIDFAVYVRMEDRTQGTLAVIKEY